MMMRVYNPIEKLIKEQFNKVEIGVYGLEAIFEFQLQEMVQNGF